MTFLFSHLLHLAIVLMTAAVFIDERGQHDPPRATRQAPECPVELLQLAIAARVQQRKHSGSQRLLGGGANPRTTTESGSASAAATTTLSRSTARRGDCVRE